MDDINKWPRVGESGRLSMTRSSTGDRDSFSKQKGRNVLFRVVKCFYTNNKGI